MVDLPSESKGRKTPRPQLLLAFSIVATFSFGCGTVGLVVWQGNVGTGGSTSASVAFHNNSTALASIVPVATSSSNTVAATAAGSPRVKMFVGVLSASVNREKREAVRQTWGSHPSLVRVVFVVSRPQTTQLLDALRKEALEKEDIIFVGHVTEHYNNITYQSLEIFRAAYAYHGPITHVLKCDDDSYIHVDRMLAFLEQQPDKLSWAGVISTSFAPIRDPSSKWYVTKAEWPEDLSHTKWSNGPGYVLTLDLVRLLVTGGQVKCAPGPLFKLEDIAVGSWLSCLETEQNITIHLASSGRFNIGSCAPNDVLSHYITPQQMRCMHMQGGQCCKS